MSFNSRVNSIIASCEFDSRQQL